MAPTTKNGGARLAGRPGLFVALMTCAVGALCAFIWLAGESGVAEPGILLAAVSVPAAAYMLIGFLSRTAEPVEFNLAGRSMPPVWNGMAGAASSLPGAFLFALAGLSFILGYDALSYVLGPAGGLALAAVFIAPRLQATGARSVPDYFRQRYGAATAMVAVLLVLACCAVLLVAEVSFAAEAASRALAVPYLWTVLAVWSVIVACALPAGLGGVTRTQQVQYLVTAAAWFGCLYVVSAKASGFMLPQIAYGEALREIAGLERAMLQQGLADARILKPHATPFLQIDARNFTLSTLVLMAGVAAFPHLLTRHLATRSPAAAGFSGAWSLFFVFLLLISAPAYAAYVKLDLYSIVARGTELTKLPPWFENASANGDLAIYGLSLRMLDEVIAARDAGAANLPAVSARMRGHESPWVAAWSEVKGPVKAAMLEAAATLREAPAAERWRVFQETILPAAARAAGNKTGRLTAGALSLDATMFMSIVPHIAGFSAAVGALLAAGAIAAALATANILSLTMANALAHAREKSSDEPAYSGIWLTRLLLLAVSGLAAAVAIFRPPDPVAAFVLAVSIAAAGLLPALVLGLWWRRASAWGAFPAMLLGAGVAVAYLVGTRYYAVDFYETWQNFSNASEPAARKFLAMKAAWGSAADPDARAQTWAALEAQARGAPGQMGIANWLGVQSSAAAIFGLPLGFLLIVLVSAVTPRRKSVNSTLTSDA